MNSSTLYSQLYLLVKTTHWPVGSRQYNWIEIFTCMDGADDPEKTLQREKTYNKIYMGLHKYECYKKMKEMHLRVCQKAYHGEVWPRTEQKWDKNNWIALYINHEKNRIIRAMKWVWTCQKKGDPVNFVLVTITKKAIGIKSQQIIILYKFRQCNKNTSNNMIRKIENTAI